MKKQNRQFNTAILTRKLLLVTICAVFICVFSCSLFACSKKIVLPENSSQNQDELTPDTDTSPEDETPSVDNTPTAEEQRQAKIEAILSSLANVESLNAETVINVSFGDKTLSEKQTIFTRTTTGGDIHTKTTALDSANAKNPYKTEENEQTLSGEEFESLFPRYDLTFANSIEDITITEKDGVSAISFTLEKTVAVGILKLSSAEANNIASDIEIIVTQVDDLPKAIGFAYMSANGNTVQIVTTYTAQT
ncbi:MAG: hypothetical protein IJ226_01155 [Clostridia bacterium]|nr:hypothetical protein [Clostridia bacterium]